jgi:hypothetical protein
MQRLILISGLLLVMGLHDGAQALDDFRTATNQF